ncbi:MAG TPA: aldo/keto reductase [Aeromicrobium sp.]|nr:aldo/keto reductase [Aeromicrobium sp.]
MHLPRIGFGTYQLQGFEAMSAITDAIDVGYRLVDSAWSYGNEGTAGAAIRRSGVARDDLLFTTKLTGRYHRYESAVTATEESLLRSGLDHLDLQLIHWPNPRRDHYVEAWQALIDCKERGLVREIGVCNFTAEHIDRLERETGVLPFLNQIEVHPFFPQLQAIKFHRDRGIVTEAWSPLGRGSDLLSNPVVQRVAAENGITSAEAVLAWHGALGTLPIPKSASKQRQAANLAAVEIVLDDKSIQALTALAKPDGRLWGGDPQTHEDV